MEVPIKLSQMEDGVWSASTPVLGTNLRHTVYYADGVSLKAVYEDMRKVHFDRVEQ